MKDGLYEVVTPYMCAGFVIENGIVTQCAPILRKKIDYWEKIATLVSPTTTGGRMTKKQNEPLQRLENALCKISEQLQIVLEMHRQIVIQKTAQEDVWTSGK